MNKNNIIEILEKDSETLENLKRSIVYMVNTSPRAHQFKIMHSAFNRTEKILLRRKKKLLKELNIKFISI